ncbi:hypothetical protein K456DRAFT_1182948 [Colletotrichum gloeosporioides 23]|nr:hypothetical protein K456DRAFT_1182948 [Colletotrichum gloeosporioides 23]
MPGHERDHRPAPPTSDASRRGLRELAPRPEAGPLGPWKNGTNDERDGSEMHHLPDFPDSLPAFFWASTTSRFSGRLWNLAGSAMRSPPNSLVVLLPRLPSSSSQPRGPPPVSASPRRLMPRGACGTFPHVLFLLPFSPTPPNQRHPLHASPAGRHLWDYLSGDGIKLRQARPGTGCSPIGLAGLANKGLYRDGGSEVRLWTDARRHKCRCSVSLSLLQSTFARTYGCWPLSAIACRRSPEGNPTRRLTGY